MNKLQRDNHVLVTDLAQKVNYLKGYTVGYSNPGKGKMIINKDGVNYLVDIEPIGEGDLEERMKSCGYLFR